MAVNTTPPKTRKIQVHTTFTAKQKYLNKERTRKATLASIENTYPTLKQRRAFTELVGRGSNTQKEAMIKAGYSATTAVAPTKLTTSKGFQMLLKQYLPQEEILAAHLEVMQDKENPASRIKAVDLAHELHGNYPKNKGEVGNNFNIVIGIGTAEKTKKGVDEKHKDVIDQ